MDRSEILEMMPPCSSPACGRPMTRSSPPASSASTASNTSLVRCSSRSSPRSTHARSATKWGLPKCPWPKELADFAFKDTPINEQLVRDLASANFLAQQRTWVAVGGTGTGKSHLAIGITRSCIRLGRKARYFNAVDLVNQLDRQSHHRIAGGLGAGRNARSAFGIRLLCTGRQRRQGRSAGGVRRRWETLPCAICHGVGLKGLGDVPSLAGRSPGNIARQLYYFQDRRSRRHLRRPDEGRGRQG